MRPLIFAVSGLCLTATLAAPAAALLPRDLLTTAAFQTTDKAAALALVESAIAQSEAILATNPADREGRFSRAMGIGYRARLTRRPADAKTSRRLFEELVASSPRDPEFQLAIGGWHLDTVAAGFIAITVLGAKRDLGLEAINRAVALGGDRAFFRGIAAMMRIRLDPSDIATARALAERASAAPQPTALDRIAKRDADALLIPLRAGDGKAAAALAQRMLPFGRIGT